MRKELLVTATLFSPFLFAMQSPHPYDFIQATATQIKFADISQFTARGIEVTASKEFGLGSFGKLTLFDAKDNKFGEEFTVNKWEVTAGYIHRFSEKTHFDYQVGYGDIDLGLSNATDAISTGTQYFILETNARHSIAQNWEASTGLEWQFWREGTDQKAYKLGIQRKIDSFTFGAKYTKYSDSEIFGIHGRFIF